MKLDEYLDIWGNGECSNGQPYTYEVKIIDEVDNSKDLEFFVPPVKFINYPEEMMDCDLNRLDGLMRAAELYSQYLVERKSGTTQLTEEEWIEEKVK